MKSTTNDLPARLLEHAEWRDELASPYDEKQAKWAKDLREAAARLERTGWRDIATAPRDGSIFQAWMTGQGSSGWWEPKCHFGPNGLLGVWRRFDGGYGFDYSMTNIKVTHWMPQPSSPTLVRS